MDSLYRQIKLKLSTDEEGQLTETQRLWAECRDANCSAVRDLYGLGTGATPAYLACMEAMARQLTKELRVTYAVRLK